MKRMLLLLSLLAGCGPTKTSRYVSIQGSGSLSKDGVHTDPNLISAYIFLDEDYRPAEDFAFALGAGELAISARLDALTAAWAGKRLLDLDGSELAVGTTLTDAGAISDTGAAVGDALLRDVVQSYARPDASSFGDDSAATPAFLTLAFDATTTPDGATSATYAAHGTVSFLIAKDEYHPCPSFGQICD